MQQLFEEPPLNSEEHKVKTPKGEKAFMLYELPSDLYVNHILSPEVLEAWDQIQAEQLNADQSDGGEVEPEETEEPAAKDFAAIYQYRKDVADSQFVWCACSLKPGYPDLTVAQLEQQLRASLNASQRQEMFDVVAGLNGLARPKEDTPENGSSTD